MKESEFQEKHPDCNYDVNIEEFLVEGYPYVRCSFVVDMVLEFIIDAKTIEECCEIADKLLNTLKGKVDYSDTHDYINRAHDIFEEKKKRIVA